MHPTYSYSMEHSLTIIPMSSIVLLRGCLYEGGPAILVGLAKVRGRDFTLRLHGKSQPSNPGPRNLESDICAQGFIL